jgi:hypothetical protein
MFAYQPDGTTGYPNNWTSVLIIFKQGKIRYDQYKL